MNSPQKKSAPHHRAFFFLAASATLLPSCSSAPSAPPIPAWITQPTRSVDGGYIVYVDSGEDRLPDQAQFKAEAKAYEDLANECSFPPKGARLEDHYSAYEGALHKSYVKVAVDFQTCEEAKQAVQPEDIRKLANVAMTDEIKRYQDLYEKPPEELASADETEESPQSAQTVAVLNARQAPPPMYVSSPVEFYVVRQQVWYAKQDVILSPPSAYPPGSPQTTTFVNHVQAPVQRIQQYEAANPAVRTSPQAWSTTHQQAMQSFRQSHPPAMNMHGPNAKPQRQFHPGQNRQQPRRQQRKKRKWNH